MADKVAVAVASDASVVNQRSGECSKYMAMTLQSLSGLYEVMLKEKYTKETLQKLEVLMADTNVLMVKIKHMYSAEK